MAAATGYSISGPTSAGQHSGAVWTVALEPPGSTQSPDLVLTLYVDGVSPGGITPTTVTLNTAHPSHGVTLLGVFPGPHTFMASQDGVSGATLDVTVTTGTGSSGTGSGTNPLQKD